MQRSTRVFGATIALATALSGAVVVSGPGVGAVTAAQGGTRLDGATHALHAVRAAASGPVTVARDAAGHVHFVGTTAGHPIGRPTGLAAHPAPEAAARAQLDRLGPAFGISNQARQLRTERVRALGRGQTVVRFRQTQNGVPVLGGELSAVVDSSGRLLSVNGETSRGVRSSSYRLTAAQAQRRALVATARAEGLKASTLRASRPQKWLYDESLVGPRGITGARSVWRVSVTSQKAADLHELVLVDAVSGSVPLRFNQVGFDRVVCDRNNVRDSTDLGPTCKSTSPYVRTELSGPTGNADIDNAFDYAGATSDFYGSHGLGDLNNLIGFDAGDGKKLRSTVRYCDSAAAGDPCPNFPNAFWNGKGMFYGSGFSAADDVVGHELTHGVTQHTSDLLYYYESGAINESMSDVLGELIDQTDGAGTDNSTVDWQIGEDLPSNWKSGLTGIDCPTHVYIRNMKNPGVCNQPDRTSSSKWNSYWFDDGGVHINSGVGNKAAYLIGNSDLPVTFNGQTITGIGPEKTAWIYLGAEQLLTSGSDYRDLYSVLRQSCTNLVGTHGIVSPDCTQLTHALQGVEMNKYPTHDKAIPATPSTCQAGYTVLTMLSDTFNQSGSAMSSTNWSTTAGYARNAFYQNKPTSGKAAYVSDMRDKGDASDPNGQPDPSNGYDRRLTTAKTFSIRSGRSSFLRFDHAEAFDWYAAEVLGQPVYWDGGFVEVSVNGGTFKPLSIASNGYNHIIQAASTSSNLRKGFGGDSTDWYTSRASLSSYAGRHVKLRFRMRTDGFAALSASYGWWLDNVRVYSCRGPSAPTSVQASNLAGLKAKLSWGKSTPNPGFTIAHYVVRRSGSSWRTLSASARSATWSSLVKGQTYTFYVYATNNRGAKGTVVSRNLKIT